MNKEVDITIDFNIPVSDIGRVKCVDAKKLLKYLASKQMLKAGTHYFVKDASGNTTDWEFVKSMDSYWDYEFSYEDWADDEENSHDFYNCLYISKTRGKLDLKNAEWEAHKVESHKREDHMRESSKSYKDLLIDFTMDAIDWYDLCDAAEDFGGDQEYNVRMTLDSMSVKELEDGIKYELLNDEDFYNDNHEAALKLLSLHESKEDLDTLLNVKVPEFKAFKIDPNYELPEEDKKWFDDFNKSVEDLRQQFKSIRKKPLNEKNILDHKRDYLGYVVVKLNYAENGYTLLEDSYITFDGNDYDLSSDFNDAEVFETKDDAEDAIYDIAEKNPGLILDDPSKYTYGALDEVDPDDPDFDTVDYLEAEKAMYHNTQILPVYAADIAID